MVRAPISYGLIGAGGFGRVHLETLAALERTGEVRLQAVCDPAIHRLTEIKAVLEARQVRLYEHYEEMLAKEEELEAVTIAAPIPFHYRIAEACLRRPLFIYLEKPPVPLLEQWRSLSAADPQNRIAVCFQLVEYDWSQRLKARLVDGSFGELLEIRGSACWPRGDGYYQRAGWAGRLLLGDEPVFDGPATNALAHLVHEIMFLASAQREEFAVPEVVSASLFRARPIESYDSAFVQGSFAGGARFRIAVSHSAEMELPYEIHVIGSKAWAKSTESGEVVESVPGLLGLENAQEYPFERAYRTFLNYVRGDIARPSTLLKDTLGYLSTTNGMLAASQGIHNIPKDHVRHDPQHGHYIVDEWPGAMVSFLESGALPLTGSFGGAGAESVPVPGVDILPLLKKEAEKAAKSARG